MGNIRHSSNSNEYGTTPAIAAVATEILGSIQVDPASTPLFNSVIGADKIYTKEDNGLAQPWFGNVFLNPPGGLCDQHGRTIVRNRGNYYEDGTKAPKALSAASHWCSSLIKRLCDGEVEAAFFVGFNIEVLQRTQNYTPNYTPTDYVVCVPNRRIKFTREVGGVLKPAGSPTHASALVFMSRNKRSMDIAAKILADKVGSVCVGRALYDYSKRV